MSDELCRRFRDKIQGRAAPGRRPPEAPLEEPEDLSAGLRVRELAHGPFPAAAALNAGFRPGTPRVRLTVDVGEDLRHRVGALGAPERERALRLCPGLPRHDCGDGGALHAWLRAQGDLLAPGRGRPDPDPAGWAVAHLIEHVGLDLMLAVSGADRGSGASCAYRDRPERFDVFLETPDPILGRAVALLSAAAVRDLCAGRDRGVHARCRDLLRTLAACGPLQVVVEDAQRLCGWGLPEALEALEALGRLGFLEPIPAPFTFSTATGLIFRRAASD